MLTWDESYQYLDLTPRHFFEPSAAAGWPCPKESTRRCAIAGQRRRSRRLCNLSLSMACPPL